MPMQSSVFQNEWNHCCQTKMTEGKLFRFRTNDVGFFVQMVNWRILCCVCALKFRIDTEKFLLLKGKLRFKMHHKLEMWLPHCVMSLLIPVLYLSIVFMVLSIVITFQKDQSSRKANKTLAKITKTEWIVFIEIYMNCKMKGAEVWDMRFEIWVKWRNPFSARSSNDFYIFP